MIYLHQFPFYNYCFDEERLENLYNNFNENKGEYTDGIKTLIQLRFISFCSDSKATFLKIDTPKNANFFFQELLDELDKSIEICENLSSKNLDKDFNYFITQIKRMNIWMIDEIIEKFDRQVEYVKNYKKSINISNEETETDKLRTHFAYKFGVLLASGTITFESDGSISINGKNCKNPNQCAKQFGEQLGFNVHTFNSFLSQTIGGAGTKNNFFHEDYIKYANLVYDDFVNEHKEISTFFKEKYLKK